MSRERIILYCGSPRIGTSSLARHAREAGIDAVHQGRDMLTHRCRPIQRSYYELGLYDPANPPDCVAQWARSHRWRRFNSSWDMVYGLAVIAREVNGPPVALVGIREPRATVCSWHRLRVRKAGCRATIDYFADGWLDAYQFVLAQLPACAAAGMTVRRVEFDRLVAGGYDATLARLFGLARFAPNWVGRMDRNSSQPYALRDFAALDDCRRLAAEFRAAVEELDDVIDV